MTDKEQIIIDGKGCRYKTWDKDCALTGDNHGDNMKPCKFIDEKSCYFKQLTRKTQECEIWKNQVLVLDEKDVTVQVAQEQFEEYQQLKQECEKLKEKLRELELKNTTLQNRNQQLDGSMTEADRYRKALEEIEEVYKTAIKNITTYDESNDLNIIIGALHNISDIINKAKGEE